MGKGGSSCFKIMACAGGQADNEDVEAVEEKASSSKRRWSFRKRSTSRRVLSNNIVTESTDVVVNDKTISEVDSNYRPQPTDAPVPAKIPVVKFVEEPTLIPSAMLESEASDSLAISEDTSDSESVIKESAAIIIQTAIRGYLARKELVKLKRVVKLQAVVRGHLVRRHAVGTLRCVQAIVKMQGIVRARRRRRNAEKIVKKEGKEINDNKQNNMYSTEKLLTNGFARQLLESTASKKSKVIHISCDPSRSDLAWKWLERWMAITSSDVPPQQEIDPNTCTQEQETEHVRPCTAAVLTEDQIAPVSLPIKVQPSEGVKFEAVEVQLANVSLPSDSIVDCESEIPIKGLVDDKINFIDLQDSSSSPKKVFSSQLKDDKENFRDSDITKETCDSNLSQISVESDTKVQSDTLSERRVVDIEKSRRTTKRMGEPRENEGKKFGFGLRKTCNPAFAAVQSKFEEMSSTPGTNRTFGFYQEIAEDQKSDTSTPQNDTCSKPEHDSTECQISDVMPQSDPFSKQESSFTENSPSHEMRVETAASECGTEISISSTLDSPDRSEAEGGEIILEIGALERKDYDINIGVQNVRDPDNVNSDSKNTSTDYETFQEPKFEENNGGDSANHISATVGSVYDKQLSAGPAASDISVKLDGATDQQAYRSSPEGSPRSHITAPESHGTPASQVSVNTKKSKRNNNVPTEKPRFQLTGKRSPANKNTETGAKGTPERLPNDPKTGKRRNSLGTGKPDHSDLEPRISNGNSLPSYMQATESARAKVHANNSPKASPDVHDKDNYSRKRHSLPLGSKQASSPRMQRSTSQVQQSSKGIGVHSTHTSAERKWQR